MTQKSIGEGLSQLSLQCALGHYDQVKALLKSSSVNVSQRDADGDRNPLHWAAERGHRKVVIALLDKGADPTAQDSGGRTAANLARRHGHGGIAMLIESGPPKSDPKQVFDGLSGLSVQAALNQPKRLKAMLKDRHDPAARDPDGDRTPLHWAAARGADKCVRLLLEAHASPSAVDASGRSCLALAEELLQGDALWQMERHLGCELANDPRDSRASSGLSTRWLDDSNGETVVETLSLSHDVGDSESESELLPDSFGRN
jgi:ankyrin repeat protein